MKPHLHKVLNLKSGDVIGVHGDSTAFVFFTDEENYVAYLNDYDYEYYGSAVHEWPFYMAPPQEGIWHLVVEQSDPTKDLDVRIEIVQEHDIP